MGTDSDTTLNEIKQMISQFVEERDWFQYHDPKKPGDGPDVRGR